MNCYSFMLDCISRLKNEDIILRSPRGKSARGLLEYIEENLAEGNVLKVMALLMSNVYVCFTKAICDQASSNRAQGNNMWRYFHILRTDSDLKSAWASTVFPDALQQESTLTFQLLCDRFLKAMIANKSRSQQQTGVSSKSTRAELNIREQNAVCYMSGYVAVSLLNRYKKLNKRRAQEHYSELSLFRSPMGLPQVAGISRWPHFGVPRDTRGYNRNSVTCIFSSMQGHCDWFVA